MNGELLPPIDPQLREQLARRSAGRLPDGLIADVSAAVNGATVERPRRFALRPAAFGAPRLAAAASLALVLVIGAALLAVPRMVTSPAGTTGYTALTTAELAALLADETQPAVNTSLVATVTVDSRNDVCPMNRYPTLGVLEGMGSQVCVMGADLNTYLSADRTNAAKVSGTFAFRYLAPGYLGLIGELALPANGVTFRATDEWPLQGRTFLVDGWLGADELTESCATTQPGQPAGDVLLPIGGDCPYDNWLGTEATAPGIAADHEFSAARPNASYDPLALLGNARHVEAGGMRIFDGIDHAAPVYGVYVVRSVTEGCPNASPIDSRGCGYWRVFARVSDTSLHAPTATATPTPAPIGAYPADRALTTDELARLLEGPQLAVNSALIASVTIDPQPDACPMNSRPTYGVIHGIEPQVCVIGPIGDTGSVAAGQNIFAFRYLAPGVLGLLGLLQPASPTNLAHAASDDWSNAGKVFLVDGWFGGVPYSCPVAAPAVGAPTATPDAGGDPLNPESWTLSVCQFNWLTDEPFDGQEPPSGKGQWIRGGGAVLLDNISFGHGIFVVRAGVGQGCNIFSETDRRCAQVLAKLADLTIPKVTPPRSPSPTPAPTATATPTVAPPATPLIPSGGSLVGLFGDGNRPLTAAEFASIWASDPTHLAGRIVIAKGPVPTGFRCGNIITESSAHQPGCADLSTQSGYVAQEGYWAVRVGADGTLSIVGEIAILDTTFVYSFERARSEGIYSGRLVLVDAWLDWQPSLECDTPPYPSDNPCWGGAVASYLTATQGNAYTDPLKVQLGAYNKFASADLKTGPVHGIFLVQLVQDTVQVLARMEVAVQ
jgi:hypothetical protein